MSRVYFTSDWHLGHSGILKFRSFPDIETHDNVLLNSYKSVVKKRDTVYFLGDITDTEESLELINGLPGTKIMVLGNHDTLKASKYLDVFDDLRGVFKYKGHWVSHTPMHVDELYNKPNVHGHCHTNSIVDLAGNIDTKYFNICPEISMYQLVPFEIIKDRSYHNRYYNRSRIV